MEANEIINKVIDICSSTPEGAEQQVLDNALTEILNFCQDYVLVSAGTVANITTQPQITLEGADTDNPRLCLNGVCIAFVYSGIDGWTYDDSDLHETKQEATKAMCDKFGVGHLVKGE